MTAFPWWGWASVAVAAWVLLCGLRAAVAMATAWVAVEMGLSDSE